MVFSAGDASAQTHTVVPDGVVLGSVTLNGDGDSLTVQAGGEVSDAAADAFVVNSGGANAINNAGLINGFGLGFSGVGLVNGTLLSVINSGHMVGSTAGIFGDASGASITSLFNAPAGIIDGTSGISLSTGSLSNVTNEGQIIGHGLGGIFVAPVAGITNLNNGGEIRGNTTAISAGSINGLTNQAGASIIGANVNAITVTGPGGLLNLSNGVGATISGAVSGIDLSGGGFFGLSSNAGTISGAAGYGIYAPVDNLAFFDNLSTGVITGGIDGIHVGSTLGAFSNSGRITGLTGDGIYVAGGLLAARNLAGGVIFGDYAGIELDVGNLLGFSNGGLIAGGNFGVLVTQGNLFDFTNEATGTIISDTFAVYADLAGGHEVRNFVNAGRIISNTGSAMEFINGDVIGLTNTASGVIRAPSRGVEVSGALVNFSNAGSVTADLSFAGLTVAVDAGSFVNTVNSGSIVATNTDTGGAIAIRGGDLVSLTNSGRIFADLGVGNYAIQEDGAGADTDLTLLPGSVIQGRIDLGNMANTDRLFVGRGLNLNATFQSGPPDVVETYGALTVVNGAVVAVADTTTLAAADNAISDVTGAISGVLAQRLDSAVRAQNQTPNAWLSGYQSAGALNSASAALDRAVAQARPNYSVWMKGFGGLSQTKGSGVALDSDHRFAGLMAGSDAQYDASTRLGAFAGFSSGRLEVDEVRGQQVETQGYFAGLYGRYDAQRYFVNFGLSAGMVGSDNERIVANNLVLGELETATASYDSYFVSPEVTVGTGLMDLGAVSFIPSARLRYSLIGTEDYAEGGVTQGGLSVAARNTHVLDARLQLAMPVDLFGSESILELRTGIDGRLVNGGEVDATLLSTAVPGFDPGGKQSSVGAFVGADFSRQVSETASLFASTELGTGTETSFHANAEAGIRLSF